MHHWYHPLKTLEYFDKQGKLAPLDKPFGHKSVTYAFGIVDKRERKWLLKVQTIPWSPNCEDLSV